MLRQTSEVDVVNPGRVNADGSPTRCPLSAVGRDRYPRAAWHPACRAWPRPTCLVLRVARLRVSRLDASHQVSTRALCAAGMLAPERLEAWNLGAGAAPPRQRQGAWVVHTRQHPTTKASELRSGTQAIRRERTCGTLAGACARCMFVCLPGVMLCMHSTRGARRCRQAWALA